MRMIDIGDHGDCARFVLRRIAWSALAAFVLGALAAFAATGCGGGPGAPPTPPPFTATATAGAAVAGLPLPLARAPAAPTAVPSPVSTPAPAAPAAATPPAPPESGRWIDVDVTRFAVRLMDGRTVVREIGPVAVGREIDTGRYESTQTGLFHVYVKDGTLSYDAPYDTYIQWWVGFDPEKANGFHSFLLDERGVVADATVGRVSNGCIRTGAPREIFEFAEIGMPVFVHV
ncbi:MAG: L,D-transpeptidase [Dehalococcoidia bacterium]